MHIAFALLTGLCSLKAGYDHGLNAGLCFFVVAMVARPVLSQVADLTVLRGFDPRLRSAYHADIQFMLMIVAWTIGVGALFVLWPEPPHWQT